MHDVAAASMTTLSLFSDILLLKSDANFRAGDLVGVLQTSPGRGKSEAQPADRSHWLRGAPVAAGIGKSSPACSSGR